MEKLSMIHSAESKRGLLAYARTLECILNNLDDMVLLMDKDRNVLYANKAVERLLGYRVEDVLGKRWCEQAGDTLLQSEMADPEVRRKVNLPHKDGGTVKATWCESAGLMGQTVCLASVGDGHASQANEETLQKNRELAISNLKLRRELHMQSIMDPLTGLFNRQYLEKALGRELHRAARRQSPLGVIMVDIDSFKMYNDYFGHDAGDAVLREVGRFLQSHVRVEDIACRYGGDEFILLLPEASLADTHCRAESLRKGVKGLTVTYQEQRLGGLNISLGMAGYPEHGADAIAILRNVDSALYRAKEAGRDQVVLV